MLVLPNQEAWQFSAAPTEAQLEDSIFLATADGMRRTEQIVLTHPPQRDARRALALRTSGAQLRSERASGSGAGAALKTGLSIRQ